MRAQIAPGGGRMTKGMPRPRVAASQMMRIQAPKMAGISRRNNHLPTGVGGWSSDSSVTQREASSQPAASSRKKERVAKRSLPESVLSNSQAAPWAPMKRTVAVSALDMGAKEISAAATTNRVISAVVMDDGGSEAPAA
jgi:hypothetical protein